LKCRGTEEAEEIKAGEDQNPKLMIGVVREPAQERELRRAGCIFRAEEN